MKVIVKPRRPIPGILPKNKWIDTEMELDLNISEMRRCMQYGDVYTADTNEVIDQSKLQSLLHELATKVLDNEDVVITKVFVGDHTKEDMMVVETPIIVEETSVVTDTTFIEEDITVINSLKEISCIKQDHYMILEIEFNTSKLNSITDLFLLPHRRRIAKSSKLLSVVIPLFKIFSLGFSFLAYPVFSLNHREYLTILNSANKVKRVSKKPKSRPFKIYKSHSSY